MRYPYLYTAVQEDYDSLGDSVFFYVYRVNRTQSSFIAQLRTPGYLSGMDMGYIVSKDSSSKFAIVGGGYHPGAIDVTDPSNPQWVDIEDPERVTHIVNSFTSTPDDRRVYVASSSGRIAVIEADPTPRVVCVDTLMPPEGEGDMSIYYITWFEGRLYLDAVNWIYEGGDWKWVEYLVILQYPQDSIPEPSDSFNLKVPTFQNPGLLKIIATKEGWFDLKLFSSTGALVDKRKIRLRKGVNLVDVDGIKSSGVYFLKIGKATKPFKLVFLTEGD